MRAGAPFRQEGRQEGRQEKYSYIIESVQRMLGMSLSPDKIGKALDLSVEEVLRYKEEA